MAPTILNPATWLIAIHELPRAGAAVVLVVALSMLALGLRGFAYYVRLAAAAAGFVGGTALAGLMHVTGWYVALPAALLALGLAWFVARWLGVAVIAAVSGSGTGALITGVFEMAVFWKAFTVGCVAGLAAAWLAPRFTVALFCATCGSLAALAAVGAVVRAPSGPLAPGAYAQHPFGFAIVGAVLLVAAIVAQVALEPEAPLADPRGS